MAKSDLVGVQARMHRRPNAAGFPPRAARVLAIEPDASQAETLQATIRRHVDGKLTLVDSKDAAIDAIARGVPDLILLSALLSPTDEQELIDHLRTLDAPHLQSLTVPLLAAPSSNGQPRGLLTGCDPERFASQITEYLDKAAALKAERAEFEDFAAQRAARGDERPAERPASEEPSPEASAGESSDPDVATPARGSQSSAGVQSDSWPADAADGTEPTLHASTFEVSDAQDLREDISQGAQASENGSTAEERDRRRFPRRSAAEVSWIVDAKLNGGRAGDSAEIINISSGGCLVQTEARLVPGSTATLVLFGAENQLRARGKVIRSEVGSISTNGKRSYRAAIQFDQEMPLDRITDISEGGCFVESKAIPPPGERICLTLVLPEASEIRITGEVVTVDPNMGFAIRFVELTAHQRAALRQTVRCDDASSRQDIHPPGCGAFSYRENFGG